MLENKALNGWNLFWLIAGPISVTMLVAMIGADLSAGPGVSSMIQLSVRCAVPWIFVAFAASSLHAVFPGQFSRWLLRNRKYFGLVFASAMAWQGFFILWMLTIHTGYYVDEVYVMRDAIEGAIGYLLLASMTITSFPFARRRMSAKSWRLLHKTGIYFLWAYAFSVYWWALFYYRNPVALDYVYYVLGLAAWGIRAVAWGKERMRRAAARGLPGPDPIWRVAGIGTIVFALIVAGFGSLWSPMAERFLYGYSLTRIPELYLPYWPFEPFLAMGIAAIGVSLLTGNRDRENHPDSAMLPTR